jgi:hypothetical protein
MTIANDVIERLKTKYGEVWTFSRGAYDFVLRCPESVEFRRYTIAVAEDRSKVWDAQEILAKHAVVYPEDPVLSEILEKRAMLIPAIAAQAASIAGEEEKLEAKKA